MKKFLLVTLLSVTTVLTMAQRWEVNTASNANFKRHFTHTIEGGFVENLPRHFIAGNENDFLMYLAGAKTIQGNSINGSTFITPGRNA